MAYKNCKVISSTPGCMKSIEEALNSLPEIANKTCPKCGKPMRVINVGKPFFKGSYWYTRVKTCTAKKCGYIWESKRYRLDRSA